MSESICLTPDEVAALRQILSMLAVIGERGFEDDESMCHISAQTWKYELVRPARRLLRVAPSRRLEWFSRP